MNEVQRIKDVYAKREGMGRSGLYTPFNPSALFITQHRERALLSALKDAGFDALQEKRILDVGCNTGRMLRDFLKYGAKPENCFGIDLLSQKIEEARELSPNIDFICGNGEALPYESSFFDIAVTFTVFSSIFDDVMKKNLASEILRTLKPEGILLIYDFNFNNPRNKDVRAIKRRELEELFDGCTVTLKRITLAPPLARMLAPISLLLCETLARIPFLCTHYMGVIRKKR